jgi:hypothetical protein
MFHFGEYINGRSLSRVLHYLFQSILLVGMNKITLTLDCSENRLTTNDIRNRHRYRNSQSPLEIHKILKPDPDSDSDADSEPVTIRCRIFMRLDALSALELML